MWEAIKNVVNSAKEAMGIEIPGLPDMGAVGDAARTAVQGVTESATGALGEVAAAGEAAVGGVAGAAETVSGLPAEAVDSATQALPDVTGTLGAATR